MTRDPEITKIIVAALERSRDLLKLDIEQSNLREQIPNLLARATPAQCDALAALLEWLQLADQKRLALLQHQPPSRAPELKPGALKVH